MVVSSKLVCHRQANRVSLLVQFHFLVHLGGWYHYDSREDSGLPSHVHVNYTPPMCITLVLDFAFLVQQANA